MRTYAISSGILVPANRIIDGKGAIIQPTGNSGRFTSTMPTAAATTTISAGANLGSRSVTVASATGIAAGQWARVYDTDANFPTFWSKVYSVSGTTVEFYRSLPASYVGSTINIKTYDSLNGEIVLKNFTFDGSNVSDSAGTPGQALRLLGFERVVLENCRAINYTPGTGGNNPFQILDCVDVEVFRIHGTDNDIIGSCNVIDIDGARSATVDGITLYGGHFGLNFWRCEDAISTRVVASGQRNHEDDESLSARSVRGIKYQACGYAQLSSCALSDFESPIKVENFHRCRLSGFVVRNAGLFTYDGQIAVAISSDTAPQEPLIEISDFLIENVGGVAVGIDSGAGSSADANAIVSNGHINECGRYAVYCAQRKLTVSDLQIRDWNSSDTGTGETSAAVYYGGGLIAHDNTFENSDATDVCFRTNFVSGEEYSFRGNARLTGNPYFNGDLHIEPTVVTASITAGSAPATVTVNHNLVRTPSQSEIYLDHANNPTNDPGPIDVSAITSTQITVRCRNDPGSTHNVHAKFHIRMPFTA